MLFAEQSPYHHSAITSPGPMSYSTHVIGFLQFVSRSISQLFSACPPRRKLSLFSLRQQLSAHIAHFRESYRQCRSCLTGFIMACAKHSPPVLEVAVVT